MTVFGPKQRSPKKCRNCSAMVQFGPYMDIATCVCGEQFLTGYEPELRAIVEANSAGTPYPRLPSVARLATLLKFMVWQPMTRRSMEQRLSDT